MLLLLKNSSKKLDNMNRVINNNYEHAFAGIQSDDLIRDITEPIQQQAPQVPNKGGRKKAHTMKPYAASVDEYRAVEKAQNAHRRGRGHKKSKRKPIRFEAEQNLVDMIEELHYRLGKTKNELYNEALELLVSKYANK